MLTATGMNVLNNQTFCDLYFFSRLCTPHRIILLARMCGAKIFNGAISMMITV